LASGKKIEVEANGLTPNSAVRIVMRSEPIVLGEGNADSDGSVKLNVVLPSTIEPGSHTLSAEAIDANGSELLSVSSFAVDDNGVVTNLIPAGMLDKLPDDEAVSRALELNRPLYDAIADPITTAAIAAGAVALLGLAGSGGLGGSSTPSSGGGSSPSSSESAREEPRKRAKLGNVVTKKLKALGTDSEGSGDRSRTWRLFGRNRFESWVIRAAAVGRFSPMLQRVIVDGSWFRAIFGSASSILWACGAILGFVSSSQSQWSVVPLSSELLIAIMALSLLDASAGLMAWLVTVALALVNGNLGSWIEIRTALGLGICYFSLALLAHVIRPLRRKPDASFMGRFDRLADYVMPPVFVAFAGVSMIKALDGLSGLKVTDSADHPMMRIIIATALVVRLMGEDVVARLYPKRMVDVQPAKLISSPTSIQLFSLAIRTTLFVAMLAPYFGLGVATIAAAILTCLPQLLKLWEDKLPNSVALHKWYPRGVLRFLVFLIIGAYFSTYFLGQDPTPDDIKNTFPLLLIPAFIGSLIELFGRDGGKWEFEWQKRALGFLTWCSAVGVVTGMIVLGA